MQSIYIDIWNKNGIRWAWAAFCAWLRRNWGKKGVNSGDAEPAARRRNRWASFYDICRVPTRHRRKHTISLHLPAQFDEAGEFPWFGFGWISFFGLSWTKTGMSIHFKRVLLLKMMSSYLMQLANFGIYIRYQVHPQPTKLSCCSGPLAYNIIRA